LADEYIIGHVEEIAEGINFLSDLTMDDLLNALEEEDIVGGADIMILGKGVTSGKIKREVGGFTAHFEDTEELFSYLKGEYEPKSVGDSLEIFQQIFGLPEMPEKVVGFVIRPT
jgi:hypothetical protein